MQQNHPLFDNPTTKRYWYILLFCFCQSATAQEQTIRYPLMNDFSATASTFSDLQALSNTNNQTGTFTTTVFNSNLCSDVNNIPAYHFEDNTGLRFDNSDNFINDAYTIEFVYQFTAYPVFPETPWLWLLGFTQAEDDGLFIYYFSFLGTTISRLEFWDDNTVLATVGETGVFVESQWYKFAITRESNQVIRLYINGSLFGSYNDVNNLFLPQPSTGNEIVFFQDNPAILSAESSPGHVREINISNYPKSSLEIANSCDCLCDILAGDCTTTTTETETTTCVPSEVGMTSDTIIGTCGCDQIITTNVVLVATPEIRDTSEICSGESIIIEGIEISTDTTICQTFTNNAGCETTRCSTVFVIPIKETEIEAQICQGESYEYEGDTYTETGIYDYSFMDENGCDSLVYINLIVFEAFTFDTNIQAPTCFGEESGAITVLVEGENESFTYAINGGDFQNFNAFFNLEAGDYTVAVMDVNECVETTILTIDSPSVLNATISTQEATDNNANGTATVIAEGGTTPYTYEWATNPIQTTETATNLSTGTYSVIVTDANNCTWQGMVEVDLSTATPNIDRIENFQVFPNPVSDKAQVRIEIPSIAIGQLTLYNSTGQLLFTQGLEDVKSQQFSLDFSTYPAGIYWMTLSIEGTSYTKTIVKY